MKIAEARAQQINAVMPLVGPLVDAWEDFPNDLRGMIEEEAPAFYELMNNLAKVVD